MNMPPNSVSLPMLAAELQQARGQVEQMQKALIQTTFSRDVFAAIVSVMALACKSGAKVEVDDDGRMVFTKEQVDAARKAYACAVLAMKAPKPGDQDPNAILHDFFVVDVKERDAAPVLAAPQKPRLVVP